MARDTYRHIRSAVFSKRPLSASVLDGELAVAYHTDEVGVYLRDTLGKVRKIGPAYVGTSAPSPTGYTDLSNGELWIDTSGTTPVLRYYDESLGTWVSSGILDSPLETDHIVVGNSSGFADKYLLDPTSFFVDNTVGALEVRIANSPEFGSFGFISETGVGTRSKVFTHTVGSAETDWVEIEAFDVTVYRSAKYIVEVRVGAETSVTEILLAHNGTDAYFTEYGAVTTGASPNPLGSFQALIATVGGDDIVSLQFKRSVGVVGNIVIRSLQTSLI